MRAWPLCYSARRRETQPWWRWTCTSDYLHWHGTPAVFLRDETWEVRGNTCNLNLGARRNASNIIEIWVIIRSLWFRKKNIYSAVIKYIPCIFLPYFSYPLVIWSPNKFCIMQRSTTVNTILSFKRSFDSSMENNSPQYFFMALRVCVCVWHIYNLNFIKICEYN